MYRKIEQSIPGNACSHCWGSGKPFGNIVTPKRIYIAGSGFVGACAPCNDTFIAEQDAIAPCTWVFDDGTVQGSWTVGAVFTLFYLKMVGGPECYSQTGGLCALVSTFDGKTVAIDRVGPNTPEYQIAFDDHLVAIPGTLYENLGAANGEKVLRYAKRLDRVNIYVKFKPEY